MEDYVDEAHNIDKYKETYVVIMNTIRDPIFGPKRDCPKLGTPLVEKRRERRPSQRNRDIIEKRKQFTRSNTLWYSGCKKFGHNLRSHRAGGVFHIRKGKEKLSYPPRKL